MGIGTGAFLFAVGAVLYWAVDVNVPFVDDNTLGGILMVVGAIAATIGVVVNAQRPQSGTASGVGSGVVMFAIGAVLFWAVDINLPFVYDGALGVILMVAGGISVLATVLMSNQGARSERVPDRRY